MRTHTLPRLVAIEGLLVLTSRSTISAGEELAYDLQVLERARIVGEKTAGGAHLTRPIRIGQGLVLMLPFARSVNPMTKSNWESVGVSPDLPTPAAEALDAAHRSALEALAQSTDPAVRATASAELGAREMTLDERRTREGLLVLRAQSGDVQALGELFEDFAPALSRHIRSIVATDAQAEDVLQDVFLIVHRKLRWLRQPETFRAWLYRIASRQAIRAARRSRIDADAADVSVDDLADRLGDIDAAFVRGELSAAVHGVSPASRAVLSLHYLEGLSLPEAARVLGVPIGTAKSRLSAGIAQLRRRFGSSRR